VKQIESCMAENRRSGSPFEVHVTSWCPGSEEDEMAAGMGSRAWPVHWHTQPVLEVFPRDQVVMLSPDAGEPLLHLEPHLVYCIGGIVDRTVRKGVTRDWASGSGVRAVRLPVEEHAAELGLVKGVCKCPILNISDVMVALLEYHTSGDWVGALDKAIPQRKRRPQVPRPRIERVGYLGFDPRAKLPIPEQGAAKMATQGADTQPEHPTGGEGSCVAVYSEPAAQTAVSAFSLP